MTPVGFQEVAEQVFHGDFCLFITWLRLMFQKVDLFLIPPKLQTPQHMISPKFISNKKLCKGLWWGECTLDLLEDKHFSPCPQVTPNSFPPHCRSFGRRRISTSPHPPGAVWNMPGPIRVSFRSWEATVGLKDGGCGWLRVIGVVNSQYGRSKELRPAWWFWIVLFLHHLLEKRVGVVMPFSLIGNVQIDSQDCCC